MKRKKIVTIGGGTGSFTLLNGLKRYPVDLSAIVSMADDGGSTGVLRDELGVLPPGDVRQCLVALSESSDTLRSLMNYRFENGGLQGHNFGNLFLSALEKTSGSFSRGVEEAMKILNVRGEVIPVTDQDAKLSLKLKNGDILRGENEINHNVNFQNIGVSSLHFNAGVKACSKAIKRINQAEAIIIGPGNMYCSLLPNLIIKEFSEAIKKSKAKVIYVCNLTNKRGHTSGWDVDDYVDAIELYIGKGRIDYVVFNDRLPKKSLIEKYEIVEGKDTMVGFQDYADRTYKVVRADVVSDQVPEVQKGDAITNTRAFIRHDSNKMAQAIMFVIDIDSNQKIVKEIL